ncbi:MAG: class I SAM-dependent methyltransferase [Rubrivivax sp.]
MGRQSNEGEAGSVSAALAARVCEEIAHAGGWIAFDRYMHLALYEPGLGYYARAHAPFGVLPRDGSDFVTAPELSPLFGRALAAQVRQGLQAAQCAEVWEFGGGSGALAEQLLQTLGQAVQRYTIVEVSAALAARQRERLARFGSRVAWAQALPARIEGVVVGNEVLDAMPARLLAFDGTRWLERGVAWHEGRLAFADRPTEARPPAEGPFVPGTVTEIHPQAQAFVATLAERLGRGLVLLLDYGFPQDEYYHPQRTGGTLMCHRAHRADADPLADPGEKDLSVHVDFTALALGAQAAGMEVLGYTSQARFLLNCGIASLMEAATLPARAAAQKLLTEHEMGELFKVLALGRGLPADFLPLGFVQGDRTHRL